MKLHKLHLLTPVGPQEVKPCNSNSIHERMQKSAWILAAVRTSVCMYLARLATRQQGCQRQTC